MQVQAAGFPIERHERYKRGIVERLVARNPQAAQATARPEPKIGSDLDADAG
ncbi:hypothetical protein [Pseudofrankia sp. BMG5.36]|uniref:hypothetical protein n=1 Tax=Pseudofrankia sp. BMG5.36 TaxID=1834512 RepID=UPI0012FF826A|nr:hypothetical protein [Pseudofrankia sp. BMG5.36]